jgi:hypothetical protein
MNGGMAWQLHPDVPAPAMGGHSRVGEDQSPSLLQRPAVGKTINNVACLGRAILPGPEACVVIVHKGPRPLFPRQGICGVADQARAEVKALEIGVLALVDGLPETMNGWDVKNRAGAAEVVCSGDLWLESRLPNPTTLFSLPIPAIFADGKRRPRNYILIIDPISRIAMGHVVAASTIAL